MASHFLGGTLQGTVLGFTSNICPMTIHGISLSWWVSTRCCICVNLHSKWKNHLCIVSNSIFTGSTFC